jgi:GNAT superfamily N-acetyltransferase
MTIANLVRPNIPKPVKREQIVVTTAQPHHAPQIYRLGEYDDEDHPEECFTVAQLRNHIRRFPEGQFVALLGDQVLAFALTMRLHREPDAEPLRWLDAIGGLNIKNHQPTGEWLYGIDFLVSPKFRRRGIGTRMYNARFDLVKIGRAHV